MSILSTVIDDLFEAQDVSEAEFWEFVRKTRWNEDQDYDRIKKMMLQTMNPESVEAMRAKYVELKNALNREISKKVEGVGDDSYDDLLAHIIGMGKSLYYQVIQNPNIAQQIIDAHAYKESFQYSFPFDDDWKMNDPKYFMDQATNYLEELSPLTTGKIQIKINQAAAEVIRDIVKRLRDIETGNFRKAVDGWDRSEYDEKWAALAMSSFRARLDIDLHYGFVNLLNDVKSFAV